MDQHTSTSKCDFKIQKQHSNQLEHEQTNKQTNKQTKKLPFTICEVAFTPRKRQGNAQNKI
jgi:hypothetical protein